MGPTTPPVLAQTILPPMDKDTPMGYIKKSTTRKILFTTPTVPLWFDASKYGIGLYNDKGMKWRWRIPCACHGVLTLNLLDFLVSETPMYMTIQKLGHGSHIPVFTDTSIDLGWMHKDSFEPVNEESHDTVARWLGWTLASNKVYIYSQYIKGTNNIIADLLSRDFHISYQSLTNIFN